MDKNQLKHIIKEEYHNVKSFMEDKYGFTPELGKVISNPYAKSFVNEVQEPEVISQLRKILKNKQNAKVKDPKSGKMMRVDLFSASAVTQVYDAINKSNKHKFGKLSLPKMVNVAFSVMKKENVVKNHDGKAAPYGSGYEKIDEVGVFPIQNYIKGIIPSKNLSIMNDRDRERVKSLIKDLVFTLNDFWKSHKIPFRVREPRPSDMKMFKKKNKRF